MVSGLLLGLGERASLRPYPPMPSWSSKANASSAPTRATACASKQERSSAAQSRRSATPSRAKQHFAGGLPGFSRTPSYFVGRSPTAARRAWTPLGLTGCVPKDLRHPSLHPGHVAPACSVIGGLSRPSAARQRLDTVGAPASLCRKRSSIPTPAPACHATRHSDVEHSRPSGALLLICPGTPRQSRRPG
jgi:hypothetical protein